MATATASTGTSGASPTRRPVGYGGSIHRLAPLALALCFAAAAPAGSSTGLYGVVRKGPITPVCRVGTPCTAPAVGVKLVFRRAGSAPRFVISGAGGRYRISLSPGRYAVTVSPRSTIGRGLSPQSAVVSTGVFRHVDFMLDTGIR